MESLNRSYGTVNNNINQHLYSHWESYGGKCAETNPHVTSPLLDVQIDSSGRKKNNSSYCVHRSNVLFGIFIAGYLMFVLTGAVIYHVLETPSERTSVDFVLNARVQLLGKYPQIQDDLNDFERALKLANGITNCATCNGTYDSNWTIGKSIFFVGTLLTTIGYGHITPQTVAGKVFTIAYATMGIPMTLILLSAFVERLLAIVKTFLLWLTAKLSHICGPLLIRLIHLVIMLSFMATTFLLMPAIVISHIEPDWDLLDSFYYCFISLTTIGLGDFIAGDSINQQYRDLYKIILTVYLYIGTTLMMLTLAIFYDIPEINIGRLFNPLEKTEDIDGKGHECARSIGKAERSAQRAKSEVDCEEILERARLSRTAFQNGLDQHLSTNYLNESAVLTKNPK